MLKTLLEKKNKIKLNDQLLLAILVSIKLRVAFFVISEKRK